MSDVWQHFKKVDEGLAKCDLCLNQVSTSGSTSNLWAHLSANHPEIYIHMKRNVEEEDSGSGEPEPKRQKTEMTEMHQVITFCFLSVFLSFY